MKRHASVIQGRGYGAERNDAVNALEQFYHAFNNADLPLMRKNWLPTEEASMANPWAVLSTAGVRLSRSMNGFFPGLPRFMWNSTTIRCHPCGTACW